MTGEHKLGVSAIRKSGGFSLIEMMIAILIGIILSIGLVQVMVAGKTASQAAQGANFMQENARFATSQLDYSLKMADHWGSTNPDKSTATTTATAAFTTKMTAAGCNGALATGGSTYTTGQNWWTLGIYGVDHTSDPKATLGANCIPEYLPGTDVVVLRYADSSFIQCIDVACVTTNPAGAIADAALYVRTAVSEGMILATGAEIKALAGGTFTPPLTANYFESPDHSNQDGLYTYPYRIEIYYVRSCSTPIAGACTAASDNGSQIPTLWRRRMDNNGVFLLEPVVEGIEQMRFEYGLASDDVSSGVIPARFSDIQTYEPANTVGAGTAAFNWLKVVSVRVGIMAQGDSLNSSGTRGNVAQQSVQGVWYLSSDGTGYTPAVVTGTATKSQLLQHTIYTTLGQLRNRDRG